MILKPFRFKVRYAKSRDNIVDASSRLTRHTLQEEGISDVEHVRMIANLSAPAAFNLKEIEQAPAEDRELKADRECLLSGNWKKAPKGYVIVRNELTYIGRVAIRGARIVMPEGLRRRVIELVNKGHQGIVKTKERQRSQVWWPCMDRDAEQKCRECHSCQVVTKCYSLPSVKWTKLPDQP